MEYRIDGDFIKGEKVFQGKTLMGCYAWVKIKQEGLCL
jgi:hypothetical protein